MGAMFFLKLVFVPLVWVELYGISLKPSWILYLYASGMHLLVAVVGLEKRAAA